MHSIGEVEGSIATWAARAAILLTFVALVFVATMPSFALAQTAVSTSTTHTNADVESSVRAFFAANPIMIEIARCESGFREFSASGAPLNGGSGGMIGVFQINARIHKKVAASMGFDINTTMGNLQYANYLYSQESTVPWVSSQSCWGTTPAATSTALVPSPVIAQTPNKDTQLYALKAQVASLVQQIALLSVPNEAVAAGGSIAYRTQ